ncbi:hypothetical protein A3K69_08590 [Candidatus Bathyarchaeota archaeon RBG_16_57_9]|nr:MAG: hypothetical protein A3K69_08590 [Candidatus Bathyarchaeota archaeon RBG_16_57_9]
MTTLGWVTAAAVLASSSLYVLSRVAPPQSEARVRAHCAVGLASVALALMEAALSWDGRLGFSGGAALGLLLITVSSGMILRFLPEAGVIRYHAASLHPAIVVALLVALLAHLIGR